MDEQKDKYPEITFTMTTFDRHHLFTKTIDSFLSTCLDLDLINRWVISDDGSPQSDIDKMKKSYPFFEIHKNPGKGQASNINNLFSLVETEWFFHCEDDWLFIKKDNYIRKLFDIAFDNPTIKNITLRYWVGGEVESETVSGFKYNIHDYLPSKKFEESLDTDWWWCGYTLNPGLQHLPTIKKIGKYDESMPLNSRKWDRKPAIKYYELGYKRGNMLDKYIEHIGDKESAYTKRS